MAMKIPCRCVHCKDPADGEDGKCKVCRDDPEAWVPCQFLDDEAYRDVLISVHHEMAVATRSQGQDSEAK